MKILWMAWKDSMHPQAGGAEVVANNLAKRLVADGHEVILLTARYEGSTAKEVYNGYTIVRGGNRLTVYLKAFQYYRKHLKGWADLVIDECNTLPFFAKFYVKERNIMFFHMLCREIWFYQLPVYLAWIGYVLEPLYLRALSSQEVITISESTKADLVKFGFKQDKITIISEGIELEPVANLDNVKKYDSPTLLSLGSIRAMKRTLDQVKAFEIAKQKLPALKMKIAGDTNDTYARTVLDYIANSKYKGDIEILGRVTAEQKIELMQKSHLLLVTSVKEGWGLVVTEANSQGTPAVVYDVDGLRDSVQNNITGRVSKSSFAELAKKAVALISDGEKYGKIRSNAYEWSKNISFGTSYKDLKELIKLYIK
jgi:glycosyltransferase involved in cell wall biosynthesis